MEQQFVHYRHRPPTPTVSHPAGSRRFIRNPMAFCGQACFRALSIDSIERPERLGILRPYME